MVLHFPSIDKTTKIKPIQRFLTLILRGMGKDKALLETIKVKNLQYLGHGIRGLYYNIM